MGNFICKNLDLNYTHVETPLESIVSTPKRERFLEAVEFNTKSLPKEIIARSLARTSKIGTLALATIEGLDIKNDIQDGANPVKEIAKGGWLLSGRKYTDDVMNLYKKYGGPAIG